MIAVTPAAHRARGVHVQEREVADVERDRRDEEQVGRVEGPDDAGLREQPQGRQTPVDRVEKEAERPAAQCQQQYSYRTWAQRGSRVARKLRKIQRRSSVAASQPLVRARPQWFDGVQSAADDRVRSL